MHYIIDGIHLNPIDSWILVFLEHGAGWVSAIIALIVLIKAWKPTKDFYHDYFIKRLDVLEEEIKRMRGTTVGSGKVYIEEVGDTFKVSDKAKRRFSSFKLFNKLREDVTIPKRKIRPMDDDLVRLRRKKEYHIAKLME